MFQIRFMIHVHRKKPFYEDDLSKLQDRKNLIKKKTNLIPHKE